MLGDVKLKTLKVYGKLILFFLLFLSIFSFLLTLGNIGNLFFTKGSDMIIFIGMIFVFFLIGFHFGKKAEKKGYLEGCKVGILLIVLLFLINLIFFRTLFSIERIIYYLILLLSSIFGSMIGINKKH